MKIHRLFLLFLAAVFAGEGCAHVNEPKRTISVAPRQTSDPGATGIFHDYDYNSSGDVTPYPVKPHQ